LKKSVADLEQDLRWWSPCPVWSFGSEP